MNLSSIAPFIVHLTGQRCICLAAGLAIGLVSLRGVRADHWPQFRGSNGNGIAQSDCPESWDSSNNVRWKVPIAGEGWSCPVVWGDQVFLTAAVRMDAADDSSSSRPEEYRGGGGRRRSDLTQAMYRWDVICLNAVNGDVVWQKTARTGNPPLSRHSSNTYATETPVTDGERVYAYFGMTGLYCYNMSGELQWQKDLGTFRMRAGWGTASSPVLFEDRLFLQIDNEEQSFVITLDAVTGDEIWRVTRDEPSQYSTPIIWQNSIRNELITGGQFTRSYDPSDGRLLWQLDMGKGRSSATPLAVGDRLYVGTELRNRGGPDDGGGFLFAIRPGGAGNLSPTGDTVLWRIERSGIQMASPVLADNHLYLLERRSGALHCVNAETGETAYRVRVPGANAFWASPWTAGDKVFCLDDNGTTYVLEGGEMFQVLGENALNEHTWSSPAVANGALFLRTADHLYCLSEQSGFE